MHYSMSLAALATLLLSGASAMTYPRGAIPAELKGLAPRAVYMCATEDCESFETPGRLCEDSDDCNEFPYVLCCYVWGSDVPPGGKRDVEHLAIE